MRPWRKKDGMTLTEMMIANAILLLVCAGFFAAEVVRMRGVRTSTTYMYASNIARNRTQYARGYNYDQLSSLSEVRKKVDERGTDNQNGLYQRSTVMSVSTNPTRKTAVSVQVWYPVYMATGTRTSTKPLQDYVEIEPNM